MAAIIQTNTCLTIKTEVMIHNTTIIFRKYSAVIIIAVKLGLLHVDANNIRPVARLFERGVHMCMGLVTTIIIMHVLVTTAY